ncbi:MAG: packaged DNA stabilization protein [Thiohalomonadales bacterium]
MQQQADVTFIKGGKIGIETEYRDNIPINMSAIIRPTFGADGYMLQQPGLTQYATGLGIDRGVNWNERQADLYRVSGTSLIKINSAGNVFDLGTIPGVDTVSMPYSFNTQGIVANGKFYLFDDVSGLVEVTDSDLGTPVDATWIDSYYVFTDLSFLYHTEINDETQIDPLKFATAEFSPDPTLGVGTTTDNKLIAFGRYTIEYFANQATSQFAFQRITSRAIKAGIVGTHCKTLLNDDWYILGGRKNESISVHMLGVGTIDKVASREVDLILGKYNEFELSDVVVESRTEDNYSYVIIHLPGETLLYNENIAKKAGYEQAWSILKSDVQGNLPWRAKHGAFDPRRGIWVYGDKFDGRLGYLDNMNATHYGNIAEIILYTPFMKLDSLSIDELNIEIIPGQTVTDDATVAISLTGDGLTYGMEVFLDYGAPSEYTKRFTARNLGHIRNWVSIKLRGASKSRMAFGAAGILYG